MSMGWTERERVDVFARVRAVAQFPGVHAEEANGHVGFSVRASASHGCWSTTTATTDWRCA